MSRTKQIIWGVALAVAGVLAYVLIPWADNDPDTHVQPVKAVEEVKKGIDIIKADPATTTEEKK